ncbi:hypothetical protein BDR26DRAFT_1005687 [Obelidium mucronatum]|nr:hypothetical protein BDR26DRAFT_1005687 [Obelidium mucronatum]
MADRKCVIKVSGSKRVSVAPSKNIKAGRNAKSKKADDFEDDDEEEDEDDDRDTEYDVVERVAEDDEESDDSSDGDGDGDGDSSASAESSNSDGDADADSNSDSDAAAAAARRKAKRKAGARASKPPRFVSAAAAAPDAETGAAAAKDRFSTVEKAEAGMRDIIAQLKASHEAKPKRQNTQLKMLSSANNDDENAKAKEVAPPRKIIRKLDPTALRDRVPKYNRVAYPITSIKPQANSPVIPPQTERYTTSESTKPLPNTATPSLSKPFKAEVGLKETKLSTKAGVKANVTVGFVPPPSSGLAYIPISEQDKPVPTQSRHSNRPLSSRSGITSWESHSRRMGYDEYVRSVSRQSADEQKRIAAEAAAVQKRELAAIQEAKDQEAAAIEAAKAHTESEQSLESELPEFRHSHNYTDEDADRITGLPPTGRVSMYNDGSRGNSRKSSVAVPGIPEEGVGNAIGNTSVPGTGISAQNQHLLNIASVLINKPSPVTGRYSDRIAAPLRVTSPGDVLLGRRGSLHAIPTITKLTASEIDLFTSTTGQFRGGPRDPHFRFLRRNLKGVKLSGPGLAIPTVIAANYYVAEKKKQERAKNDFSSKHSKRIQGAQAMKEHAWAVSRRKYTVGSGTGGFDGPSAGVSKKERDEAVNENELRLLKVSNPEKYKRYIEKEKAKSFLLGKWEVLEQLRIQIVAKTTSLKHYHSYFQELSKENAELREKHKEITHKTNTKISQTLECNEDSTLDIIRIDRERKRQFQILQGTFDDFESKADQEIDKLVQKVDMTQKTVDRITLEISKLMEFKSLKESNPTAIFNEIKEIKIGRDNHIRKRAQELEQIKVDWRTAQAEIELTWMAKVQTLIDAMGDNLMQSLKVHVDTSPSGNYHQNGRLRHEIAVHQAQQAKAQMQIDEMLEQRKVIAKTMEKVKDKRRNVLRLKEQMTCSPEMEFEVTPRNLLVKELGI